EVSGLAIHRRQEPDVALGALMARPAGSPRFGDWLFRRGLCVSSLETLPQRVDLAWLVDVGDQAGLGLLCGITDLDPDLNPPGHVGPCQEGLGIGAELEVVGGMRNRQEAGLVLADDQEPRLL